MPVVLIVTETSFDIVEYILLELKAFKRYVYVPTGRFESVKVVTLGPTLPMSVQTGPRYILKPASLFELSTQFKVTLLPETVAVRLVGARGLVVDAAGVVVAGVVVAVVAGVVVPVDAV